MKIEARHLPLIVNCIEKLSKIDLPIWYELSMNVRAIRPHYIEYQQKADIILSKYGTRKEDGTVNWGKNSKKADEQWNKLNSNIIDIDFINIDVNRIKNYNLPVAATEPLMNIFLVNPIVAQENAESNGSSVSKLETVE